MKSSRRIFSSPRKRTSVATHVLHRALEPLENRMMFAAGSLNTAFGGVGYVVPQFPNGSFLQTAAAVQTNGKTILIGSISDTATKDDIGAIRLNTDGSLDTTFGTGGYAFIDTGAFGEATAVAIQPDDSIVIAGLGDENSIQSLVVRLTPNGALDSTFGTGGKTVINFNQFSTEVNGIALQGDGKILAVAQTTVSGSSEDYAVARLNKNGSLDSSFGTGGIASPDVPNATFSASSQQPIVVIGTDIYVSGEDFSSSQSGLIHLFANGSLDSSFDNGRGIALLGTFGSNVEPIAALPSGQILLAESSSLAQDVLRINANGSTDSQFGVRGSASLDANGGSFTALGNIAVLPDGSAVIGGFSTNSETSTKGRAVIKLTADGLVDTTFGTGGQYSRPAGSGTEIPVVRPDGSIIVADQSATPGVVTLLTPQGTVSPTFNGGNLKLIVSPRGGIFSPTQLLPLSDGSFYIIGSGLDPYEPASAGDNEDVVITRFLPDGNIDTSFGQQGQAFLLAAANFPNSAISLHQFRATLQSDGKILLVSVNPFLTADNGDPSLVVARFTASGQLDTTFGVADIQAPSPSASLGYTVSSVGDTGLGIATQPDGKIIILTGNADNSSEVVARFNSDGTPDTTFGVNGSASLVQSSASNIQGALAMNPDGTFYAGTVTTIGDTTTQTLVITRFLANGQIDTTYGNGGSTSAVINTAMLASGDPIQFRAQSDGKLLVFYAPRSPGNGTNTIDATLLRFNADGSPDSTFGTAGVVTVAAPQQSIDVLRDFVLQPDGKIVVAGTVFSGSESTSGDAILIRLNSDGTTDSSFGANSTATLDRGGSEQFNAIGLQGNKLIAAGFTLPDSSTGTGGSSDFGLLAAEFLTASNPPTATLSPITNITAATASVDFTVNFSDDNSLNASSITGDEILVTGPGFSQTATLISTGGSATNIAATYRITAPAGSFNAAANGTYIVTLNAGSVADTSGLTVAAATLGSFTVNVAIPPTATAAPVTTVINPTASVDFTVTFSDDLALNSSSIGGDEILVTGPGFSQTATLVGTSGSGSSIIATYRVTGPGGSFNPSSSGTYTITLNPNSATDSQGLGVAGATLGTFIVNIPTPPAKLGGLDSSFGGGDGVATVTVTGPTITTVDTVFLSDGRQYAAGYNSAGDFVVLRFLKDGTLDSTFGTAGVATIDFRGTIDVASGMLVLKNGTILIAGTSKTADGASGDFAVARLTASGALDGSFAGGGKLIIDVGALRAAGKAGTSDDLLRSIALAANGQIYLAGTSTVASGEDAVVVRIAANGAIDRKFGKAGIATIDFGGSDEINGIAIQKDGQLVVVGDTAAASGRTQIAIARLTTAGILDAKFGVKGKIVRSLGGTRDLAKTVAIAADGTILVGGFHGTGDPAANTFASTFALLRYTSAGKPAVFGRAGAVTTAIPGATIAEINRIFVAGDGSIFVSGSTGRSLADGSTGVLGSALVHYTASGALDTTFATRGILQVFQPGTVAPGAPASGSEAQLDQFIAANQGILAAAQSGNNLGGIRLLASAPHDVMSTDVSLAQVIVAGFDLTATLKLKAPLPKTVKPGTKGSAVVMIKNLGNATARGRTTETLYLSKDRVISVDDIVIKPSSTIAINLAPKASQTANINFTIPAAVPTATYFLLSSLNTASLGKDLNATNNASFIAAPLHIVAGKTKVAPKISLFSEDRVALS